jgi:type IV pilus assembly protein PilP
MSLPWACGDRTESEKPHTPAGLRKKISAPRKPIAAQETKSEAQQPALPSKPDVKEETIGLAKTEAEPFPPDKRDIVQPGKSDFLALAEGMTKRPDFFYDPRGKHDPFESLFEVETESVGIAPAERTVKKKRMPLTPLQRVSLGQLKLVAIVLSPTGNKALVEEPSGKGYVISKGTYIGQNYERVKDILKDRVIVEGEVEDFVTGSTKLQTTELKLQKKVGDG